MLRANQKRLVDELSKEGVRNDECRLMSHELPRNRSPLLPDRRPTPDFFVCDILDAAPKGDMASMEHPIFSLSTKPDLRTRRYEHGAVFIEVAVGQGIADGTRSRHSDLLHLALDGDPD